MKRSAIIFFAYLAFVLNVSAQQPLNEKMQQAYDACWAMRTAIATGNTAALKSANEDFKKCHLRPFASLRQQESDIISLDGHFVWDDAFADSLIEGRDVRKWAQRYAERGVHRGASGSRGGAIVIKSSAVKGNGKAKFTFVSHDHQEIAVIAEPHGNVTLRVFCKKTNKWHNDDEDVKRGRESRTQIFDIPEGVKETVELEVINCGDKDISFVVISN